VVLVVIFRLWRFVFCSPFYFLRLHSKRSYRCGFRHSYFLRPLFLLLPQSGAGFVFFAPLFIFCACTASVLIGVDSATLILCAPFYFFTLAGQASCIFDGDFVIVSMFFFCALLFFVLFTAQP
jgi:hypothetical protein